MKGLCHDCLSSNVEIVNTVEIKCEKCSGVNVEQSIK